MSEEGFHEIQLSGKQLVFLFMATTVVAVVIFLSGVMVGRGVRAEAASETEGQVAELTPAAGGAGDVNPAAPQPKIDTSAPPPQPVNDELSYYSRLEKPGTPSEKLKAADAPASAPARRTETPAPAAQPPTPPKEAVPPAEPANPPAASRAPAKPSPKPAPAEKVVTPPAAPAASSESGGFAVQVAALGSKGDASALAQRLTGKGYDAYVVTPAAGTASVFRVRVGHFKTRQDADSAARKLEKEEKFKPWVVR